MRVNTPFPLRYTEWLRWNGTEPLWGAEAWIFARELYNHTGDTRWRWYQCRQPVTDSKTRTWRRARHWPRLSLR
jgi:hypothetical protein